MKLKTISGVTIGRLRNFFNDYLQEQGVSFRGIRLVEEENNLVLTVVFKETLSEFSWDKTKSIGVEYSDIARDVLTPMIEHLKTIKTG